ncbi:LINE-1 retrotransposable element ORF2 protein [Folsomia candida]|uniref:LINE-1 retrotransposable element ORF2 protein n=1 Tax=Folsomia candida TaxID=158441 RepID=A0A226EW43_FOLCA|nr:LINE-1 retrotransposable element ORF2 protein [Folsomia candida]
MCSSLKQRTKSLLKSLRKAPSSDFEQAKDKYVQSRQEYSLQLKASKQKYKNDIIKAMLNHRNTTDFWATVNIMRTREFTQNKIPPESWTCHYETLFASKTTTPSLPISKSENAQLDYPITLNEVMHVLHKLKTKKAPGHDGIPNEVWKSLPLPYIQQMQRIFNNILDNGTVPEEWTTILLQPIYKKGDPLLPQNYRPIALAPTILKVFSTIISKRVHDWAVTNNKISKFQAGCKKGMGTQEHLFTLLTLIQSRLRLPKGRLYVTFVDLKSAYDSPGHADLWDVLSNAGMGSKIINVLISLYSRANGQVKLPSGLSDKFKIRKGVLQGEPQSGLNFNIFINDLVKELDEKGPPPIQVGDAKLHLLLFVDVIALLGDTPSQIQQKINIAARFFHRRSLQVNVDKTKVVIFAKKKSTKLLARSHFHWENQSLEIAPSYKYLGVTFSANGTFTTHTLESRAKIATAATKVWDICRKSRVPPIDTHLKLFNSLVKSTLLYASPIWGWGQEETAEKAQSSFVRKLLRLPPTTPAYFCRLESGVTKIQLQIFKATLDFWIKTVKNSTSLTFSCLKEQFKWYEYRDTNSTIYSSKYCWAAKIVETIIKLSDLSYQSLLSHDELSPLRNVMIAKYADILHQQDLDRCRLSNFIPLYQYLRPDENRPSYLNQNLSLPIVQLYAQLRLNRFSVKLGPHYIKLETRCPLCTSHASNNVQHTPGQEIFKNTQKI